MYTRQIKAEQHYLFKNNLDKLTESYPIQSYYQCDITVNGTLYILQLRLLSHHRIVASKAIRLNIDTHKHELVTDKMMLGALTEFALSQYGVIK